VDFGGKLQSSPQRTQRGTEDFAVLDSNVLIEADIMNIRTVGVVGAGTMGNGIAHVFARGGFNLVLCDVEQRFLERALGTIAKNLEREVAKNKITAADKDSALGRIQAVTDRSKLSECDFVVEAATEKFEIKTEIFHSGVEYFFDFDHQARRAHQEAGESDRDALLQSGASNEAGGGDPGAGDFTGYVREGAGSVGEIGKDARRSERRAGICFEPGADAAAE
jgi:NAD(P)-dependent dehydrogenase (short-subunit alcohol dehydrogenase family)